MNFENFSPTTKVREFRGKCCGAADDPVPESEQDIAYRLIEAAVFAGRRMGGLVCFWASKCQRFCKDLQ